MKEIQQLLNNFDGFCQANRTELEGMTERQRHLLRWTWLRGAYHGALISADRTVRLYGDLLEQSADYRIMGEEHGDIPLHKSRGRSVRRQRLARPGIQYVDR
jgi:hypothetical protein